MKKERVIECLRIMERRIEECQPKLQAILDNFEKQVDDPLSEHILGTTYVKDLKGNIQQLQDEEIALTTAILVLESIPKGLWDETNSERTLRMLREALSTVSQLLSSR